MIERLVQYSIRNKLVILLFTFAMIGFGIYSLLNISIGAVPDITTNQVQVITTSRNLSTQDVEKFLTYPVELEMANLPGVKEIRSISKFGLSVVTIVFEDKMGTYLPRQLIAEKIKSAEEKIPPNFGKPFMGPVSTGLGEIYQYVIEVEPAYQSRYSVTDLRTIQDWIVKRHLSGIPGVVEVNTWGGYLKQYEVSVDPERLRAMNLSISEVYTALEKNNSLAGGGYIDKMNESYFIRGQGLVASLQDIENIVVANRNGIPLFIKDVAKVGFGHANRFGAITGNGEGEKVLGQVMMLKGANSKEVIENVKKRVAEIQSSLPKGVRINAFLERSELIEKTTFTIAENLVLGCLIVVFVVVLLLGNLRSGLVVASIIPLCLLFALSLMYIFGIDANLMSLGAIDFGIIIDGAVIIVEFVAFKITAERQQFLSLPKPERRNLLNTITYKSTTKMMRSAVFGQLIIIIVFIPILSLTGIEGKMFRPMALVFCFALIGAMILCFTYVPVVSSLFLKPSNSNKKNISNQLIHFLQTVYKPVITWGLKNKSVVLGLSVALLIFVAVLFSKMGGEFVPTLDEGDFVIQPVLKTGTSLNKTIELSTRMEKILKKFPVVEQVVTRIGAAEVPTDPMSMEESDVIIKLKPRSEWGAIQTKDELADTFKQALSEIPGVDYEFTQPIEMRFNELITGVRVDLAVKIYGEDLDVLYQKALEVRDAIQHVEGAADITVEKTVGLPQMAVQFDRMKIAKYGLDINHLNNIIQSGFAGLTAGTVFEGEKQFDLVIRFDETHRKDIEDIKKASVLLPNGNKLPLSEFAEITYTKGPAKISRDDTKRRIIVGVNVRNRDLESVVNDIRTIINDQIKLPTGYTLSYGGQFQNLKNAKERLMYAVPIALILIFILLYFAFKSVKEALLIYSAIPLAAVGGVLLLYLRDMPFSISAGVGFIALFGVAVLNGIVLIEHFKELKTQGIKDIKERVLLGTKQRLRPVLLTATAASLGFLPMAISTSAGAEVQRPLATVVIGGLISATLLTLIVLPVLYTIFNKKTDTPSLKTRTLTLIIIGLFFPFILQAQRVITEEKAIQIALENNKGLKASSHQVTRQKQLIGAMFDVDKTQIFYEYDQNNIDKNGQPLHVWGIRQSFQFPTVYAAQKKRQQSKHMLARHQHVLYEQWIKKNVSKAFHTIIYRKKALQHYRYLDSLYRHFTNMANRKYELGETNYLEKLTAESKQKEIALLLEQNEEELNKASQMLHQWFQDNEAYVLADQDMVKLPLKEQDISVHPSILYYNEIQNLSRNMLNVEKQKWLPDLTLGWFQGSNNASPSKRYVGGEIGLSFPLWFQANKARVRAAKTEMLFAENQAEDKFHLLQADYRAHMSDLKKFQKVVDYYENTGKKLANELFIHAEKAFQAGEIDFFQYIQLLENAKQIEIQYLQNLHHYNQTVLEINYLTH